LTSAHGGTFLVQAAWFAVLLALLAALSPVAELDEGHPACRRPLLLLVITTAVALQPFHGRWLAPGADSFSGTLASEQRREICVHPAFASTLMELPGLYGPIMSKLESTPAGVTRLEQRPRGIDGAASPGALPISFDNAAAGTLDASVVEFINNLLKLDCYTAAGAKAQPWETVVADWLEGDLDGGQPLKDPFANAAAAQWFSGLTPSGRHTWFVAHYSAFTNCTLSKTDFGS
jgi:hypothetical protein